MQTNDHSVDLMQMFQQNKRLIYQNRLASTPIVLCFVKTQIQFYCSIKGLTNIIKPGAQHIADIPWTIVSKWSQKQTEAAQISFVN